MAIENIKTGKKEIYSEIKATTTDDNVRIG